MKKYGLLIANYWKWSLLPIEQKSTISSLKLLSNKQLYLISSLLHKMINNSSVG